MSGPNIPQRPEPAGVLRDDEFDGHVFEPSLDYWPFGDLYTPEQMDARYLQGYNDALALRPSLAPEFDVRTILLDIVPGDGGGLEVYAKNVDDVVNKLTELSTRLEEAESKAAPAVTEGSPMQGLSAWLRMMASHPGANGADFHTLRQWAAEVDAVAASAVAVTEGEREAFEREWSTSGMTKFKDTAEWGWQAALRWAAGGQYAVAVFDEMLCRPKLLPNAPMLKHGQQLYTTPQHTAAAIHVCQSKDIVCGDRSSNWCEQCPKRKLL